MNKLILLYISLLIILGCQKKEETKKEEIMGTINCTYNDVSWEGHAGGYGFYAKKDSLFNVGFLKPNNNIRSEDIIIFNVRKNLDIQFLHKWISTKNLTEATYLTNDIEEDVSCDSYEIVESDSLNNWIQITDEKNNYGEIWGKFSATFVKIHGCNGSPYPDTVRIRNGTFHIWKFNYY